MHVLALDGNTHWPLCKTPAARQSTARTTAAAVAAARLEEGVKFAGRRLDHLLPNKPAQQCSHGGQRRARALRQLAHHCKTGQAQGHTTASCVPGASSAPQRAAAPLNTFSHARLRTHPPRPPQPFPWHHRSRHAPAPQAPPHQLRSLVLAACTPRQGGSKSLEWHALPAGSARSLARFAPPRVPCHAVALSQLRLFLPAVLCLERVQRLESHVQQRRALQLGAQGQRVATSRGGDRMCNEVIKRGGVRKCHKLQARAHRQHAACQPKSPC